MLTLSIAWVVLAATATIAFILTKSESREPHQEMAHAIEPGKLNRGSVLSSCILGVYGIALLAGFLYITWQQGIQLIR